MRDLLQNKWDTVISVQPKNYIISAIKQRKIKKNRLKMLSHFRNDSCLTTYLTTLELSRKWKKPESLNSQGFWPFSQQGMRESNSHQKFWRLLSYHLTNPLYIIVLFQTINIITYLIHFCKCTFKTSYKVQESNVFESRSSRFRFASSRWFCYAKLRLYQVTYPQTSLLHATSYILPSFSALVKPSID